jgi:quinoprotein dehydrogenase-associated probable ABC transporter substrate-binding protein
MAPSGGAGRNGPAMIRTALLAGLLGLGALVGPATAQTTVELVSRTELRVCADPNDLPFSNDKREGFENKIAEIIGKELNLPVTYVWFPQVVGFVRNTLRARQCDLVMGTVSGDGMMDNTNAYYHSGYMIVSRTEDGIGATGLGDPVLADKKIGLIAATPPTDLLLRHGLMPHVTSYALAVDTRYDSPARAMIQDILDRKIDVGLLWGPLAGYYIKHETLPLKAAFLDSEPDSTRLDFRIAMGVRPGEPEWRRRINGALEKHRAEVAQVLAGYDVPLLDEQGHPLAGATGQ